MDKANPHCPNEKQLFHGCAGQVVDDINHGGFNRNFAGVHGEHTLCIEYLQCHVLIWIISHSLHMCIQDWPHVCVDS